MKVIATINENSVLVEIHKEELAKIMGEDSWWSATRGKSLSEDVRNLIGKNVLISESWDLMKKIKEIRSAKRDFLSRLKNMKETLEEVTNPVFIEEPKKNA